ncbi:MAG: cobalamin B12-binding domain-containing protein [Athalassotoga sp.]|uniref:lysine 5,6-aminomutase subunit beta n=1 Tax=Athalassotoga sp. TaxID=2022597 RepID=UPI003D042886
MIHNIDLEHLRPYGDQLNDGVIQLSFTLPVPQGAKSREAAKKLIESMGFSDVQIVHSEDIGEDFTFFVIYAKTTGYVNYKEIKTLEVEVPKMGMEEINEKVFKYLKRQIVVVGATIGSDAHTVGLDSILNMKGYHGDSGLERYKAFKVYNLGSQIPPVELVRKAREYKADVILVSQIVTQRDIHIKQLTELADILDAEKLRDKVLLIVGGPRITHELAVELGYDAGFGAGTMPSEVASYIVEKMVKIS